MQVQWPPVDRTAYARGFQFLDKCVTVDRKFVQAQTDGEQMPGGDAVLWNNRQLDFRHIGELLAIPGRQRLALESHRFGPFELVHTDGRGDVGEIVLVTS